MNKADESKVLLEAILEGIHRIKGKDITHVDLESIDHTECGHFIICHGTSSTHVDSIAHTVEQTVKEVTGEDVWHRDGYRNALWILLDYGDVMVHVFQEEARRFYNLEGLWADAKITKIEEED
ncbi:ribosome silencing factor [uncultured Draconibacterium sp.]|uniref:ribosome silencing factor n=1 Tax=uncultured Draconibacterium sp. TaxID=1573823 RepID=UPI0029C943F3|nr:ribosome silencing factor [uncultured Draconibacterium sp.]